LQPVFFRRLRLGGQGEIQEHWRRFVGLRRQPESGPDYGFLDLGLMG